MNNTGIPDNYTKLCPSGNCSGNVYTQAPLYSMGTGTQPGSTAQPLAGSSGGVQMAMPQNGTQMSTAGQTQQQGTQYLYPQDLLMKGIQDYQAQTPAQPKWSEIVPMMPSSTVPITAESMQYLNGYLRTQIGKRVTVEFLIGTNTLVDKTGLLLGVGVNYIILNQTDTDDITICDFYNIKFITVYY